MERVDLIVIGGGPAGYVAAERAGEAGMRAMVGEQGALGGVCLNCGCIPSKTLLNSAKRYHHARHSEDFGVVAEGVCFDMARVAVRKGQIVETLRKGVAGIMKRSKVKVVDRSGAPLPRERIQVVDETGRPVVAELSAGRLLKRLFGGGRRRDGEWTVLENVRPGSYTVVVKNPAGEVKRREPVTVKEGEVVEFELVLEE